MTSEALRSDPGAALGAVRELDLEAARLGVATIRERTSIASRLITSVAIIAPVFGVASAAGLLWGVAFHPVDLYLFLVFYLLPGLGITVGYHRLFTHKAFVAPTAVRVALAVLGSMTLQGPVTQWVTDHRKHHARSDQPGDPHSPNLGGRRARARVAAFFHSHVGWLFSTKGLERGVAYGRDLYDDRAIRAVDRAYFAWVVLSVGLPFLFGYAISGSTTRGLEAMVWAGLVRIFCFQHATFAVNSVCHTFGRRPYDTGDRSTNNVFVALATFGEGWHNNHHAFPRSARHGLSAWQVDVSYLAIRALEALGLARSIRIPTERQLERVARTA